MPDPIDLDACRETINTALAFIRSGAPATDLARMPTMFLAVGAAQQLLAEVERLTTLLTAVRVKCEDMAIPGASFFDPFASFVVLAILDGKPGDLAKLEAAEHEHRGLRAERDAMRPVVEAAVALYLANGDAMDMRAFDAVVGTYLASHAGGTDG